VQNFRGMEDSHWFELEDDFTVLVGKNESGKTSVLEALNYFCSSDKIAKSKINVKELDIDPDEHSFVPVVDAVLQMDSEDSQEDLQHLSNPLCITKYANGRREISYNRTPHDAPSGVFAAGDLKEWLVDELQEGGYFDKVVDGGQDETWAEVYSFLYDRENQDLEAVEETLRRLKFRCGDIGLDNIYSAVEEYESDASDSDIGIESVVDKIPDAVFEDSNSVMSDEVAVNRIPQKNDRISSLLKTTNIDWSEKSWSDSKRQMLGNFSAKLTEEISPKWGQKDITINLSPRELSSKKKIVLRIGDRVSNGPAESLSPPMNLSQRSDGLKRFVTILLDMYLNNGGESDNIILIDDPGVYFHPNQKEKMRDVLTEKLAKRGQVVYSTHSPFLIDSSRPKSIRAVQGPSDGVLDDITEISAEDGVKPARPVSEAMGLTIGTDLLTVDRCLLVEGATEYHLVPALSNHFRTQGNEEAALDGYRIIQMSGAGDAIKYSKWANQGGVDFQLLLDNDEKGEELASQVRENHPELNANIWLLDERDEDAEREVEFEDLLPTKLYIDTLNSEIEDISGGPQIEVERGSDSEFVIGGEEYSGVGLTDLLSDLISAREDGFEYRKASVARRLAERIRKAENIDADFSRLVGLFAQIRNEDI
jgi:predicted ATP-dependent endonuclease of OLD family